MVMLDDSSSASNSQASAVVCLACDEEERGFRSNVRLRPLPSSAGLPQDPDGIDWNDYYWGHNARHGQRRNKQRTIVRPLPRSITIRIPLEVFVRVMTILQYDGPIPVLYRCALVHRDWAHHALRMLYSSRVLIHCRAGFEALVRSASRGALSYRYPCHTRSLYLIDRGELSFLARRSSRAQGSNSQDMSPPSQVNAARSLSAARYTHTIPLRLSRLFPNLECLHISNIQPPYPRHFVEFMPRFTHLVHLALGSFTFQCFGDLRRIICGLPKLRRLDILSEAKLATSAASPVALNETPNCSYPRIFELQLVHVDQNLLSPLAAWIAAAEVCEEIAHLSLFARAWNFNTPESLTAGKSSIAELFQRRGDSIVSLDYHIQRYTTELCMCLLESHVYRTLANAVVNLSGGAAPPARALHSHIISQAGNRRKSHCAVLE